MKSRTRALAFALGSVVWTAPYWAPCPRTHGQPNSGQAAPATADLETRLAVLDKAIKEHLDAGRFADAITVCREKLQQLAQGPGKHQWKAVDARLELEAYQRLVPREGEIRERFQKARQAEARAEKLFESGKAAEGTAADEEALAIKREALGEDNPETAASEQKVGEDLYVQGKYVEAEAMHRRALATRLKALGKDHPEVAKSYNQIAMALRELGKFDDSTAMHRMALAIRLKALGEEHPDTATSYLNLGVGLGDLTQFAEAEAMLSKALAIHLRTLPENHLEVASTCNALGAIFDAQGKNAESEAMHRRALAIRLEKLGDADEVTATSYNNLAGSFFGQGKYGDAETMTRQGLAIRLKTLGPEHPSTINSYHNLGVILGDEGKFAEAEAILRRAVAIELNVFGEAHPYTGASSSNLAAVLRGQGKYTEAESILRRALANQLKNQGESNPNTATSYHNLAETLFLRGEFVEAEAMHRQALTIRLKAFGENHHDTAWSYNHLAEALFAERKLAEAEEMHRHALAINLKGLGEEHPVTSKNYDDLAKTLVARGQLVEAEGLFRRALSIRVKTLGDGHHETAGSSIHLARCLEARGKYAEALPIWASAVASYEKARRGSAKGLGSALVGANSPLAGFALALARAGKPRDAWMNWEQGLARSLVDEINGRATRPSTDQERELEASLLGQIQSQEERISRLASIKAPTREQSDRLDARRARGSELRGQVLELEQQLENKYGALAGKTTTLELAQKAMPEGTALVGWVDGDILHYACLLRHDGDPIWVPLAGSGKDGAWTRDDEGEARQLYDELNPETAKGRVQALALARLRLSPLRDHVKGIKRLIVVNSPSLSGVPIEVLAAALADPVWEGLTVSYTPSASMFVHLHDKPAPSNPASNFFAVADPAYPADNPQAPSPTPPDSGLAIAGVVPNGNADLSGLQQGDVLLSYAQSTLAKIEDLHPVTPNAGVKKVPVTYWRDGVTREIEVPAGPLGLSIDPRPAKQVVQAREAAEKVLLGMRGGSRERLPGTRREVEAIGRLFPESQVKIVMGEQACESNIQELAHSGKLKGYRYLHFATHGESDPRDAYRSALILAPDPSATADPLALDLDGKITAEQVARTWELDADLVVLSACESGLGRAVGGEGYLGFAQPLIAKGARSLILSLWKVDDDATALLMTRFYQNLLGKRDGLKASLPKAEALSEAKAWLRLAGEEEVGKALALLPRGEIVRREVTARKTLARPYEEPTYWAGFILVGSPD